MKFLSLGAVGAIRVLSGKDFWNHGGEWTGPAGGETVASASWGLEPSHSRSFFFSTPMHPLWGHSSSKRLTPYCPDWELPASCEHWYVEGCSGKEAGGATHHCVSGFITWSLMGVFLPHLGPTFWDFLSTYDNLTHSGYKGNATQEKELWTLSQKQGHFPAMWWGNLSDLRFLICKINITMPPSQTCCRN